MVTLYVYNRDKAPPKTWQQAPDASRYAGTVVNKAKAATPSQAAFYGGSPGTWLLVQVDASTADLARVRLRDALEGKVLAQRLVKVIVDPYRLTKFAPAPAATPPPPPPPPRRAAPPALRLVEPEESPRGPGMRWEGREAGPLQSLFAGVEAGLPGVTFTLGVDYPLHFGGVFFEDAPGFGSFDKVIKVSLGMPERHLAGGDYVIIGRQIADLFAGARDITWEGFNPSTSRRRMFMATDDNPRSSSFGQRKRFQQVDVLFTVPRSSRWVPGKGYLPDPRGMSAAEVRAALGLGSTAPLRRNPPRPNPRLAAPVEIEAKEFARGFKRLSKPEQVALRGAYQKWRRLNKATQAAYERDDPRAEDLDVQTVEALVDLEHMLAAVQEDEESIEDHPLLQDAMRRKGSGGGLGGGVGSELNEYAVDDPDDVERGLTRLYLDVAGTLQSHLTVPLQGGREAYAQVRCAADFKRAVTPMSRDKKALARVPPFEVLQAVGGLLVEEARHRKQQVEDTKRLVREVERVLAVPEAPPRITAAERAVAEDLWYNGGRAVQSLFGSTDAWRGVDAALGLTFALDSIPNRSEVPAPGWEPYQQEINQGFRNARSETWYKWSLGAYPSSAAWRLPEGGLSLTDTEGAFRLVYLHEALAASSPLYLSRRQAIDDFFRLNRQALNTVIRGRA